MAKDAMGQGREQLRDAAKVAKEIADKSIQEAVDEVTAEVKGSGHCGCHSMKGHGQGSAFAGGHF
jgi:hypothetical protein